MSARRTFTSPVFRLVASPVSLAATLVPGLLALVMGFVPTFVLTHGLTGAAQVLK